MSDPTQVLEHPQNRVGDSIDVGQERFGNDGDSHGFRVAPPGVAEVACRSTAVVGSLSAQNAVGSQRRSAAPAESAASVDDEPRADHALQVDRTEVDEFRPLGEDRDGIGTLAGLRHRDRVVQRRENPPRMSIALGS